MDWNGLLNFQDDPQRNMLMQVGLGLLAGNQSGNPAMGAMRGFQNAQEMQNAMQRQKFLNEQMQMQKDEYGLRKSEYERKIAEDQARKQSIQRLLGGQGAYTSEQEVPVQSFQNVPIPAVNGAQAPNFGTTRESVTTMQKKPVFDQNAYMQDLVAAGMGDDLIRQQFTPKKTTWQDVGGEFVQLDDSGNPTGKKMPKSMAPKEPQIFTIKKGRTEIQYYGNMSDPQSWQEVARASMDAPQRDSTTMIAVPDPNSPTGFRYVPSNRAAGLPAAAPTGSQKTPTEFQAKAGLYFGSMKQASQTLNTLEDSGADIAPGTMEMVAPGQTGANIARGKDRRSYVQAQRQWIDSINRVRSGANLPEIEYDRAVMTFFPQYQDDAETIKQKRIARQNEEALMAQAAGPALPQQPQGSQQVNILPQNAQMPDLQSAAQEELKRRRRGK